MFKDLVAYTGFVRLDGPGKMITRVDLAKDPEWSGDVVRFFEHVGDRLLIRTPEMTLAQFPGRPFTGLVTFEREHAPWA